MKITFSCHYPEIMLLLIFVISIISLYSSLLNILKKLIYLLLAMLDLCCWVGFSVVVVHSLLIAVASFVAEQGL